MELCYRACRYKDCVANAMDIDDNGVMRRLHDGSGEHADHSLPFILYEYACVRAIARASAVSSGVGISFKCNSRVTIRCT